MTIQIHFLNRNSILRFLVFFLCVEVSLFAQSTGMKRDSLKTKDMKASTTAVTRPSVNQSTQVLKFVVPAVQMFKDGKPYEFGTEDDSKPKGIEIRVHNNVVSVVGYCVTTGRYEIMDITIPSSLLPDNQTIQSKMEEIRNKIPDRPDISCDELIRRCKGAINLYWGNIFSIYQGRQSKKTLSGVNGTTMDELMHNSSLLINHGWEYECPNGPWKRTLFFSYQDQKMQTGSTSTGVSENSVSFGQTFETVPCRKK